MAVGYQNPFYLKQAQKKLQSLYDGKVLHEKHDPPVVYDLEETLQLAQETDASLAKHKALELEIEHLLKAVVSQDIMIIMQNESVVDTSDLQTKLEPYNDMQQTIERLQAQLGNLKGKSKDTSCVSDTRNPLSQKLKNKNVELEFQVLNYARENAHFKATYKNMFDSISVSPKFVGDFKSLAKEADDSLAKHKALELEIERLLKAVNVNGKNSYGKNQKAKISVKEIQQKYQPKVSTPKKVGTHESLATPKPRKPRFLLRWSPTGKLFNQEGKLVDSSEYKSKSNGDNACTSNVLEPKIKRFPNSTSLLDRNDLVVGLLKFKYHKEHLCPSYEQGKSKRASYPPKPVPNSRQRLHLLHMDLCGPMRIASINEKRYVLVIVDDYSRHTWSPVIIIRTDNGTEFKNQVLKEYFDTIGISHQMSSVRTPQQNGVVERRNWTLVEAARTIKPDISFLHVFGALCYPKNDREDIGKLGAKGDIGFFIGYSADSCAYRVYNRRTKKIMETMNVSFDELSAMAFKQRSSKPGLNSMTSGNIREPLRPVLTRNQLRSDGDMCMYALSVSTIEPKNVKEAMTDLAWIDSMQE
nr:retrovirus-related Pol polyprotein from transposon TNT 1-94 [Tanacetum cinerariifolium]